MQPAPEIVSALQAAVPQVALGEPLGLPRDDSACWSASSPELGPLVVKLQTRADRRAEKTSFAETWLPRLGERGYPVPRFVWHGPVGEALYAVVQTRLPGEPLRRGGETVSPPSDALLAELLALVELQEDAGASAAELAARDFASWQEHVVFDGWGGWWDAAAEVAPELTERFARLVRPLEAVRLPRGDFAHNDLNLSNILVADGHVSGVVDWDELGFGTRAGDLVGLAYDCAFAGARDTTTLLLERARDLAGPDAVAVLFAYSALGRLAVGQSRGWGTAFRDRDIAAGAFLVDLV